MSRGFFAVAVLAVATFSRANAAADSPVVIAVPEEIKTEVPHNAETPIPEETSMVPVIQHIDMPFNGSSINMTLHDHINDHLAEDEERVLSGGEVKVRKKRTFCKRCYPTQSYGYGGGGGCCGQCGQCGGGGGYGYRPIRVIKVVKLPSFGGYGGGGGCGGCYNPCSVCGR